MTEAAQQRLGRHVRTRRRQLGHSINEAAQAAEVNPKTWQALERGTRAIRDHSYAGIERALRWRPGSIDTILDGGEPASDDQTQISSDSLYVDPHTGELYRDETERQLWDLDRLPEETRRRLIYYVRAERQAAQAEGPRRAS